MPPTTPAQPTPQMTPSQRKPKLRWIVLIIAAIIVIAAIITLLWLDSRANRFGVDDMRFPPVKNFTECVNQGYPVQESYPRTCTANGVTYTEAVNSNGNENVNASVNGNTNTASSGNQNAATNSSVAPASNYFNPATLKKGDKVGVMTTESVQWDGFSEYTVSFSGEVTVKGFITPYPDGFGDVSNMVCLENASATSAASLPTIINGDSRRGFCFTNSVEAKAALVPDGTGKSLEVLIDSLTSYSEGASKAHFVRLSTVDETANWKLYTNTTLGFTLKFPPSWDGYTVTSPNASSVRFTHPKQVSAKGNPGSVSFTITRLDRGAARPQGSSLIDDYGNYTFVFSQSNAAAPDEMNELVKLVQDIVNTFSYTQ